MTEQSFEVTYAQMLDGELAKILRDRRDLVPEAKAALDREIQNRRLDPSQLRKLHPHGIDGLYHPTEVERRLKGKKLRGVWLLATIVMSVLLIAVLDHFGIEQLFWPISITIVALVFTIWGHWELKQRVWFWVTIAFIAAAHAILYYFVQWPWGSRWVPAATIKGICTLDLIAIFGLISLIEKLLHEDEGGKLKGATCD